MIKDDIKLLRQKTGLSQKKFAEYFGIPISTYEQWEMGIRKPAKYIVKMMETILKYEKMI